VVNDDSSVFVMKNIWQI